jgi:hypothetical protein
VERRYFWAAERLRRCAHCVCAAGFAAADAPDAAVALAAYRTLFLQQLPRPAGSLTLLLSACCCCCCCCCCLQDFFLRTWFASYLYGQLSWVQLARLHVGAVIGIFYTAQSSCNTCNRHQQQPHQYLVVMPAWKCCVMQVCAGAALPSPPLPALSVLSLSWPTTQLCAAL